MSLDSSNDDVSVVQAPRKILRKISNMFSLASSVPDTARAILALRAFGLSLREISARLSIGIESVRGTLMRYDADNICEKGDELRRFLLSMMLQRIGFEAIATLTSKDLAEMSPEKRIAVAAKCLEVASKLAGSPVKLDDDESSIIDGLRVASDSTAVCELNSGKRDQENS